MTLNIPYSFIPGTKAKAQEVNANFNYVLEEISNNAANDFSNLSENAEKHFLNKMQITNCILEAPNGVASFYGSENKITIKSAIKVLIPNGLNDNGSLNNVELTSEQIVFTNTFANAAEKYIVLTKDGEIQTRNFLGDFSSEPTAVNGYTYYDIKRNRFYVSNDGSTWEADTPHCHLAIYSSDSNGLITSFKTFGIINFAQKQELERLAPKKDLDQPWVYKVTGIFSNQNWALNTTYRASLDNYLPDDGGIYQVLIKGSCFSGTTSGNMARIVLRSDYITTEWGLPLCAGQTRGNGNVISEGNAILLVGSGRYLEVNNKGNAGCTNGSLTALAYRKVR